MLWENVRKVSLFGSLATKLLGVLGTTLNFYENSGLTKIFLISSDENMGNYYETAYDYEKMYSDPDKIINRKRKQTKNMRSPSSSIIPTFDWRFLEKT